MVPRLILLPIKSVEKHKCIKISPKVFQANEFKIYKLLKLLLKLVAYDEEYKILQYKIRLNKYTKIYKFLGILEKYSFEENPKNK